MFADTLIFLKEAGNVGFCLKALYFKELSTN